MYKRIKTATTPVRKITTTTPAIRPPVQLNPLFTENGASWFGTGGEPRGLCRGGGGIRCGGGAWFGGGGVNTGGGGAGALLKLLPPILKGLNTIIFNSITFNLVIKLKRLNSETPLFILLCETKPHRFRRGLSSEENNLHYIIYVCNNIP